MNETSFQVFRGTRVLTEQLDSNSTDSKGRFEGYRLSVSRYDGLNVNSGIRFHGEAESTWRRTEADPQIVFFTVFVQKTKSGRDFGAGRHAEYFHTEAEAIAFGRAEMARKLAALNRKAARVAQ